MENTMRIQFEAGNGVNILNGENDRFAVYAEVDIVDGASEDYGYLDMKNAVLAHAHDLGIDTAAWVFWYDGQEQYLAADASAHCKVYVEIETEDEIVTTTMEM